MSKPNLYENYEDALFALLMEEVSETEGEALINTCHELGRPNSIDDADDFALGRKAISGEFNHLALNKAKKCTSAALKAASYVTSMALVLTAAFYGISPDFRTGVQTLFSPTAALFDAADYLGMTASDFGIVKPNAYAVESHDVQEAENGGSVETVTYENSQNGQDVTVRVYNGVEASSDSSPAIEENEESASDSISSGSAETASPTLEIADRPSDMYAISVQLHPNF